MTRDNMNSDASAYDAAGRDEYEARTAAARERHVSGSISSSVSGSRVGDLVAAKRANLIHAQGEPRIGRREPPEPYDPRPKRIMYAKGIAAGAVVLVVVIVIVMVLASGTSLG